MNTKIAGNYSFSYWEQDVFLQEANLIIIGAGIVGLSTALHYRQLFPQHKIIVLERGMLPSGASTRNAGYSCFGSISEIMDDLNHYPKQEVIDTLKLRWDGLNLLRKQVPDHLMDYCDTGGVEVFTSQETAVKCYDEMVRLNSFMKEVLGLSGVYSAKPQHTEKVGMRGFHGAILNSYEGLLHPGKMMSVLLSQCRDKNINLYFGAEVVQIEEFSRGVICMLSGGKILSDKVVIATNGFARRLIPDLDVAPARNQVLLIKPSKGHKLEAGYHMDAGYFYFRPVGEYLLIGGGRHLAFKEEATDSFGLTGHIQESLEQIIKQFILPDQEYEIVNSWSGILGIGSTKKPLITMIGERVVVAVRMGGMGVAIGSMVGKETAELIRFHSS
jgi:gamma-glutamylputrescine oxidase